MATKPEKAPVVPPAERTIGQLVAETLHVYGQRFWACLALGIGPAVLAVTSAKVSRDVQYAVLFTGWPLLMTASYVGACFLVLGRKADAKAVRTAAIVGFAIAIPVPLLVFLFVLPAVFWLALLGLAVPASIAEGLGIRDALRRGIALARADYGHAAGTLATLVILTFLTSTAMFMAVRAGSGEGAVIVAFLAFLVISPVLFLGTALLYDHQVERAAVRAPNTKKHGPSGPR